MTSALIDPPPPRCWVKYLRFGWWWWWLWLWRVTRGETWKLWTNKICVSVQSLPSLQWIDFPAGCLNTGKQQPLLLILQCSLIWLYSWTPLFSANFTRIQIFHPSYSGKFLHSLNANVHFDLFRRGPRLEKTFYQERLKKVSNFSHSPARWDEQGYL